MTTIITRLYASPQSATSAADELKKHRFNDNDVFVVGPSAGATADDVAASLAQAGVAKSAASAYADGVSKGGAVVVVHAPFGSGQRATSLLDRFEPLPVAAATSKPATAAAPSKISYDEAAPLSSQFQWKILSPDPTPLSTYWKWPVLNDYSISRALGLKQLTPEAAPLSKAFGWAVLKDDPAPLSSKFNWPILRD